MIAGKQPQRRRPRRAQELQSLSEVLEALPGHNRCLRRTWIEVLEALPGHNRCLRRLLQMIRTWIASHASQNCGTHLANGQLAMVVGRRRDLRGDLQDILLPLRAAHPLTSIEAISACKLCIEQHLVHYCLMLMIVEAHKDS